MFNLQSTLTAILCVTTFGAGELAYADDVDCPYDTCTFATQAVDSAVPLRLPYRSGEQYAVTQGYCFDAMNEPCSHTGFEVDFALPEGTIVVAAAAGTIVMVGPDSAFGNALRVVIEHTGSDGLIYRSAYYHLSAFTDGLGQEVEPAALMNRQVVSGEPIGLSGNTGISSGAHLHFQLKKVVNGASIGVRPVPMTGSNIDCGGTGASISFHMPGVTYSATGDAVFGLGSRVEVFNVAQSGLTVREQPCGNVLEVVPEGLVGEVIGGPECCVSERRWKIRWPNGVEGWSAQPFLRAAPESVGPACELIFQPGAEGIDTCWGTAFFPNGAPDNGKLYFGGWGDAYVDYIAFDLSEVPSADQIESVRLDLWAFIMPNDPQLQVYRVTGPWTEASVTQTSNPPSVLVGPFGPLVGAEGWRSYDLTDLCKSWKSGALPNYGLKFVPLMTNQTNGWFWSSDFEDPTRRPRLVVTVQSAGGQGDLDCDGQTNGADLSTLLGSWGTSGPGDLNNNGTVGGEDLAILLSAWTG